MTPRDILQSAVGNLTRHKARTALTTVGVIVGILTIVTMVSLGIGVQREMIDTFRGVGLESLQLRPVTKDTGAYNLFGQPERTKLLTPELVGELQARDDVVELVPFLRLPYGMSIVVRLEEREANASPWGPRPGALSGPFEVAPQTLAGVDLPPEGGGGTVLGEGLLTKLGYDRDAFTTLVGEPIQIVLYAPRGDEQAFDLVISGITDHKQDSLALALADRLEMLEWWYNDPQYLANRGYDEVQVRAASLNAATQIVGWLDDLGYEVQSLKTMLDLANRGMIILQTMLGSVGALALLVASIGIANTMIMSVYERTKEIGLLKAVGAAPGQIRGLFVVEASLIGLLGGVIGTVLGWLLVLQP